jgi:integrator complex subunit 9
MSNVPVYFISSVADQSIAFSNIFAEWLCESKQNLVHAAESPFQHAELAKSGLFKLYPGITGKFNDDFHTPCVVFASHPSLRFGEACHFVELWKSSPANSILFTDAEFNHVEALAPYQPVYANAYFFPIDTSLTTAHLNTLLKEPRGLGQLVLSGYYKSPTTAGNSDPATDLMTKLDHSKLAANTTVNYYTQNDIVKLVTRRKYENCDIEADLAHMIILARAGQKLGVQDSLLSVINNIGYCKFDAHLVTRNNQHTLRAAPKTIPLTRRDRINMSHLKKYTYGKLNFERFVAALRKTGVHTFRLVERDQLDEVVRVVAVERDLPFGDEIGGGGGDGAWDENGRYTIEIDCFNKIDVDLAVNRVSVLCDNEECRVKVKDALLKCLKTL